MPTMIRSSPAAIHRHEGSRRASSTAAVGKPVGDGVHFEAVSG